MYSSKRVLLMMMPSTSAQALERDKTYSFLIYGDRDWYMTKVMEEMGVFRVDTTGPKAEACLIRRLVEEGGQLEAPTDYITLR